MSVEAEWMAIPQSKLESLVASMLERIKVVLASRGGLSPKPPPLIAS